MWIHWPFFPKTWTKGHWPLDDLWPHVCWGHMCDSTQGSLCPSPMTIHQCMWIQWSILQITTYIHTHTTYILRTYYILHTTYRMSDHIVSYWTQFRRDKNMVSKALFYRLSWWAYESWGKSNLWCYSTTYLQIFLSFFNHLWLPVATKLVHYVSLLWHKQNNIIVNAYMF